ncbi:NAD-dependent epimerase/dehydratase family protein [Natronolimnobius baerhuensis]|uniref:Epimerase n=1 Tax=Natronolimnobius baerhuensis TaxID=253108 RepID=A0A202E447_9EURY|nr:NAD(P)-dependent oxidoreductase [Natronolimnobius baerhuensis]OVE82991.1 epimerase [Natronolimnobius baerhuensis]
MDVLVTGSYGRCGTAIIDHLDATDDYNFTYLNRSDRPADHPYGSFDTHVADIADSDAIRPAFTGQDAVIHLAAYPYTDGNWDDVFEPNILGMYNALTAARDAGVETFIYGSTNHVVGQYELEHAPDIYRPDHDITVRPTDPIRPDSYYGTTKAFGELLGRQYIEADHVEFPTQFYALRICTVNSEQYDHPYGDAEFGVDAGDWDRSSEAYDRAVNRMKAMWHSRRDFAHLIECCLQDKSVEFDIFHGVSDNDRRWFSLRNARDRLGYDPVDDAAEWTAPPQDDSS